MLHELMGGGIIMDIICQFEKCACLLSVTLYFERQDLVLVTSERLFCKVSPEAAWLCPVGGNIKV